ncbi:cyclic lactone autoinducer peptide [Aequitasia blattaphilus]|uniref:Cyclic lactone autoinducer peptide n=1 Tax=Aequitasia blattaphilus TaxID=2949332 RepID=A0ABT1EC02_9FIRM|nr:cyclic lactone autoinducer peptide [Aequitasia blattaphilus]MCP1103347.1 cyclic lactone autoinducer peptide [Aequitasia blattaphilus]MCR8615987.1 cyclic lactone autoinducer peptide [Aequitasia blattaphilus]
MRKVCRKWKKLLLSHFAKITRSLALTAVVSYSGWSFYQEEVPEELVNLKCL